MFYATTDTLYRRIADLLLERIGTENYYNGSILLDLPEVECRLTCSVIVYRYEHIEPGDDCPPVRDVVPVWWELHTVTEQGEIPNDFSFSELRPLLGR